MYIYIYQLYIRRPRPSPRQGRRLGPPQVWSLFLLACHSLAFRQALRPLPSVVKGVQACFEQALRPLPSVVKRVCHLKRCAAASSRHSGGTPATALCCEGRSSLPLARPQMPKTLRGSFEQAFRPLPSVVKGVQACRLPGLKCLKRCAAASSRHSGHCPLLLRAFKPQATALCC